MTITTQFVSIVQEKAMQGLIMLNIFTPLFIGGLLALLTVGIEWAKTDKWKWNWKLFLKAWLICFTVIALLMIPSTISDYRLWRDFPAQMIVEKLL